MKHTLFCLLIFFALSSTQAQQQFHVFPANHAVTPGTSAGNGSLLLPWDLQTALNQPSTIINGGDTIWLHGGIYNGRYKSILKSTEQNRFVTVASYPNEWAILNGNGTFMGNAVLSVNGNNVIYKDFEITALGIVSRSTKDANFQKFSGVFHSGGVDCQFINLIIHKIPGLGFGSWKETGGTMIANCFIFNNGYVNDKGIAFGEGMYVQNNSTKERIIKDNIIFSNYYKGIEVWSANKKANTEYVKNITLDNNVIFNSGLPSGVRTVDNIIVASGDRNGINSAKNITVKNNILYHNIDFNKNNANGDAPSLTIGFNKKAPVENVSVDGNIIIGKNNALRLLHAKSLTFSNNIVYSGYVVLGSKIIENIKASSVAFNSNQYYSKNGKPFRVSKDESYRFSEWKANFKTDTNSKSESIKAFNIDHVLDITKNTYKPNQYRVVLFDKTGKAIDVDFSKENVQSGMVYTIRDVENYKEILTSGTVTDTKKANFKMQVTSQNPHKTLNNFGVYIIDFSAPEVITESKDTFFKRLLGWLF